MNIISPFGSEKEIEKKRVARNADRAFNINHDSPHTKLLIQNAVNHNAIEFMESGARQLAEVMSLRELSDNEHWEIKTLTRIGGYTAFDEVISGDIDIEVMSMRLGLHPEWVMVSATNAKDVISTLFSSIREYEHSYGFLPKQFQQELIDEFADRFFAVEYDTEVRAVDFSDMVSAARSIKTRLPFVDCRLLAWHLGRIPIRRGENYQDKERFLNQIEEALNSARQELNNSAAAHSEEQN